jgi:hypothetical protein
MALSLSLSLVYRLQIRGSRIGLSYAGTQPEADDK